jgi:nucleoid DNA-binding protein
MRNKELKRLIHRISLETMLPDKIVEDIVKSQFDAIRDTISSGDMDDYSSFKNISVKYLGKFFVKESRLEAIKRTINDSKAD